MKMNSEDKVIAPETSGKDSAKTGTKIKCIIEITQPDGEVVQVEVSSVDLLPELDKIDLSSRKGLMDFISMTDKGIIAIRNEAGKKAIEAYARKALKKTNRQPKNDQ